MRNPKNIIRLMEEVNPDFVGFIFYPGSKRYFLQQNSEIPIQVPSEKRTGVFVDSQKEEILKMASRFQLGNVQLHGDESPQFCKELKSEGIRIIKAIKVSNRHDILLSMDYEASCDYILFDTKDQLHGGTGKKFDWYVLHDLKLSIPYFLSGGIDPDDSEKISNLPVRPFAIDINSRFELEPGVKSIQLIREFKKQLNHHE